MNERTRRERSLQNKKKKIFNYSFKSTSEWSCFIKSINVFFWIASHDCVCDNILFFIFSTSSFSSSISFSFSFLISFFVSSLFSFWMIIWMIIWNAVDDFLKIENDLITLKIDETIDVTNSDRIIRDFFISRSNLLTFLINWISMSRSMLISNQIIRFSTSFNVCIVDRSYSCSFNWFRIFWKRFCFLNFVLICQSM